MTKIIMMRHGEPDYSYCDEKGFIGHGRDLAPLTEKGIEEVEQAASDPRLKGAQIILSSPYTRALQTAAILSRLLNTGIIVEPGLHEWLPDMTFRYDSSMDVLYACNDFNKHKGKRPQGEACRWEELEGLRARVGSVVEKYLDYEKIILVSHGMVMRSLKYVENIPYAGIVEFDYEKGQAPGIWVFE